MKTYKTLLTFFFKFMLYYRECINSFSYEVFQVWYFKAEKNFESFLQLPLKFKTELTGALDATAPFTRWGYFKRNQAESDPSNKRKKKNYICKQKENIFIIQLYQLFPFARVFFFLNQQLILFFSWLFVVIDEYSLDETKHFLDLHSD